MKRILTLGAILFSICAARAEWPQPITHFYSRLAVANDLGAVVVGETQNVWPRIGYLTWFSRWGEKLADIEMTPNQTYNFGFVNLLNDRQLALVWGSDYVVLYTLAGAGKWTVANYPSWPNAEFLKTQSTALSGFYQFTNEGLTRVDFPVPPVIPASEVTLVLESASSAGSPWGVVGTMVVPVDKTNAIYRLRISR